VIRLAAEHVFSAGSRYEIIVIWKIFVARATRQPTHEAVQICKLAMEMATDEVLS